MADGRHCTQILLNDWWRPVARAAMRELGEHPPARRAPSVKFTVDVIVPVYGNWNLTRVCLDSLVRQTIPHRVIVVDDASPDDTLTRLAADYPAVEVIALEVNSGFAAACNHGLRASTADIVVLVNNDVEAQPTLLERLIEPFADPAVGSASPLVLRPDGRIDALGITADVTMAGFLRLHGAPDNAVDGPTQRLAGPYGAVAAYRSTALAEVGLLDEGIVMYGEELDLALRLSAAGWRPAAAPAARAVHLGGATSGRGSTTQRLRAGYGRGYLLRAYRVLRRRHAVRAIVTEFIVCLGDLALSHDLASARGRLAGWRAGARATPRTAAVPDVDASIGLLASLRLRVRARS
ncbi:glycosyltransferase [Lysinimonas soli]|uniref:Glycosyltransferase n=1 Tax=Lysinimonas soli TaxID=1074233 RepID=A0ABW0NVT3_9MICO